MPIEMLKIRLFPTKAQEALLNATLETCRQVYNSFLLWRMVEWEMEQKAVGYHQQAKALPVWKKDHPELFEVFSQVLQNVAVRVDLAFKAFFRRCRTGDTPGFPRFKGLGYDSFTYPQAGFALGQNCVTLSKIGTVQAVVHRTLEGVIKTCTLRRQGEKWFACFAVEVEREPLPPSSEAVGIDLGLEKFAALSNGEFVENPRFFRKDEKALAKAQRKLARQKRGSKERRKAKKVVRRIHERIANRRYDFVHQTARRLVNRFGLIAIEKLNVKRMQGNHCLAKSISDAAWSMFGRVLAQKAESAGRKLVNINPAYTSQDCSGCGHRPEKRKKLSERWHFCPNCGLSLDRDTNAAVNILQNTVGLHSVFGIPE